MRWFVEISSVGLKPGPSTTLCVEALQWQPALQKARALRGDGDALSNFSIELLEDGFRAIDPASRLRYVVKRAPDDAALSSGTEAAGTADEPLKKRPIAYTVGFGSAGTAQVNEPSAPVAGSVKAAPTPVQVPPQEEAPKRAMAQTMTFGSPGAALLDARIGAALAARATAPVKVAPTIPEATAPAAPSLASIPRPPALLPSFQVVSKREENPTERSPLHYREHVFAVAPGTSLEDARRVILDRFEHVREDLDQARPGKLINLAIFDHVFQGRPLRRPMVTLTWKDWKNEAPEIQYPLRDGSVSTPPPKAPSVPPPAPVRSSAAPSSASAPSGPTLPSAPSTAAPSPSAAAPIAIVEPPKAPSLPPATTAAPALVPAPKAPVAAFASAAASAAKDTRSSEAPVPPTTPIPTKPAAALASPAAPLPAPAAAKSPSTPAPARASSPVAVVAARPKKRLSGDDLLSELFEAFGDLHFLTDSLEGADFVLKLTLEKLPSEVGLVSLFDINKREFVVVRQAGGPRSALCQRQPESAFVATTVMRKGRAVVIADAEGVARAADERWRAIGVELKSLVCAPVELGGRYLGLIELANPLDGGVFNEGDGNALTYIGQQLAEFVASHGIVTDPELIRERAQPAAAPKRGR